MGDFERFGRLVDAPFVLADKDNDETARAVLKVAERALLAFEGFVTDFVDWIFIPQLLSMGFMPLRFWRNR